MANQYREIRLFLSDLEQLRVALSKLRNHAELGTGSLGFVNQAKGILTSLEARMPRVRAALDREKKLFDKES